ncbi:IS1096 element passenger TnpR family protein [Xenorhabdus anantnagensis]|uniref:Plasmid pRiA4b Orf3-like domain-containing protein n=1 Tax=Xenorhabdus anantnagensis TaxID=3025875 RepID=A0ABT5LVS9_9GAMM|nr:hypothetical protein [Xenorhabdus anantnagensis]MDC9598560.1 hypothetical protein [Xenorhabdus anantnagensis]
MVWRRFRLSGETSLAAFHYIIQVAQGWQLKGRFLPYSDYYYSGRAGMAG